MKKGLLLFAMLFSIVLTGQVRSESISDFTTLKISKGIHVDFINSDKNLIEISGEKADKVEMSNKNNSLKLSLTFPETADGKVKIKVFYNKKINEITVIERSKLKITNINQDNLEIIARENAFVDLAAVTKTLKVTSNSGSIVKLKGTTNTQQISTDTYGNYEGFDMEASESSTVFAGTGGKAEVSPGKKLTVRLNFGGSVFYKGETELIKEGNTSGGIIKKRN